jgi:hypothetical protein
VGGCLEDQASQGGGHCPLRLSERDHGDAVAVVTNRRLGGWQRQAGAARERVAHRKKVCASRHHRRQPTVGVHAAPSAAADWGKNPLTSGLRKGGKVADGWAMRAHGPTW